MTPAAMSSKLSQLNKRQGRSSSVRASGASLANRQAKYSFHNSSKGNQSKQTKQRILSNQSKEKPTG